MSGTDDALVIRADALDHQNAGLEAAVALLDDRRRALVSECDALRVRLELVHLATLSAQARLRQPPPGVAAARYCLQHLRPR